MSKHIEKYLDELKEALSSLDKSTIQDALADAEDHLTTALQVEAAERPEMSTAVLIAEIIEKYGTPEDILEQYSDIEEITTPIFAASEKSPGRGFRAFCSVVTEPRAWAACLYMLLSLVTGIAYFTLATTGLSVSLSLLPLIIGIPVTMLFLLSVRAIGFVEGRMVEALLGVRMPRRAISPGEGLGWWSRFKIILSARSTWTTIIYMLLMMPLGVVYFTLTVTLFSLVLSLIGAPVIQYILNEPILYMNQGVWIPFYVMPVVVALGAMLVVLSLHLAKQMGKIHGRFAKAMLVS